MIDHLVETPFIPTPGHAVCAVIAASDGVKLRTARWRRTGRAPLGTICILQGRAEFIEKYFEVVADLRRRGFAVVAFDWRGQGGSEHQLANARKGHVDDFDLFHRDLDAVMTEVVEPHCPKPWFALAHSMGANVFLRRLQAGEKRFERAVLSSPMVELAGLAFPAGAKALASGLNLIGLGGSFVPGGNDICISAKPFEGNKLSSDRQRYERNASIVRTRPELGLGDPTVGWVDAAFRAMGELADPEFGARFSTPTLMVYGNADRLCSGPAVAALARRIRLSAAVEVVGGRHELMMERDALREKFFAAFDAFIPGETAGGDTALGDTAVGGTANADMTAPAASSPPEGPQPLAV
ncbi:MAG: alpha/beta hydrolase [Beijerinckiaceae bacterium]|nr:alpha/beta hydrolase [Beijerinckiaceae bacterium]